MAAFDSLIQSLSNPPGGGGAPVSVPGLGTPPPVGDIAGGGALGVIDAFRQGRADVAGREAADLERQQAESQLSVDEANIQGQKIDNFNEADLARIQALGSVARQIQDLPDEKKLTVVDSAIPRFNEAGIDSSDLEEFKQTIASGDREEIDDDIANAIAASAGPEIAKERRGEQRDIRGEIRDEEALIRKENREVVRDKEDFNRDQIAADIDLQRDITLEKKKRQFDENKAKRELASGAIGDEKFQERMATLNAARVSGAISDLDPATQGKRDLLRALDLYDIVDTGKLAPLKESMKSWISSGIVGFNVEEITDSASVEELTSLLNSEVVRIAKQLGHNPSNADVVFLKDTLPGFSKTNTANKRIILNRLLKNKDDQIELGRLAKEGGFEAMDERLLARADAVDTFERMRNAKTRATKERLLKEEGGMDDVAIAKYGKENNLSPEELFEKMKDDWFEFEL